MVRRRSDGTIQQRRVLQSWPTGKPFRILSIDGGGIRGVFPAAYLAELERRFLGGASVGDHFDMIAGTSTGGIITLALAKGMTAEQALSIYTKRGEKIFPSKRGLPRLLRWATSFFKPKHDQAVLREELKVEFGTTLFGEARNRCVIPSFDGLYGEPVIYKTPHHPDYKLDQHKTLVDIALHTTAAPTIFPAVKDGGYVMIDGGIWANNPIMNALVDALACYDVPRENIRILSLGTGEATFSLSETAQKGGKKDWAILLPFLAASRAQSKNALGQAFLLTGKDNVIRIDVPETDTPIALDDVARSLNELPHAARSLVEASGQQVFEKFLLEPALPYAPCVSNGA
ncbi:CBASS cGAMP-activated phospholipase [Sneathiella aquimaris]|uniref:CBASS cGAMP-activated phospholipase n=1 Tax=Sneathiella aquimaris TaxID=2599305 RepID=UPI001C664630|nr:CBASS cGAMP-activated phospholipase [Sneathiella aquimaris]